MRINLGKFNELYYNHEFFLECVNYTTNEYRNHDNAFILYRQVLEVDNQSKFTLEFIVLLYRTLKAWNMNSRLAQLSNFDDFKNSIQNNRYSIISLNNYRLENITNESKQITFNILHELFNDLDLTSTDTKIVTFSKTLHFMVPNLVPPMDRTYTFDFFYNYHTFSRTNDQEFECFTEIFNCYIQLARKYNYTTFYDTRWNRNIPKIIDNAIIGYQKLYVQNRVWFIYYITIIIIIQIFIVNDNR